MRIFREKRARDIGGGRNPKRGRRLLEAPYFTFGARGARRECEERCDVSEEQRHVFHASKYEQPACRHLTIRRASLKRRMASPKSRFRRRLRSYGGEVVDATV